jgi:hypothetical protein
MSLQNLVPECNGYGTAGVEISLHKQQDCHSSPTPTTEKKGIHATKRVTLQSSLAKSSILSNPEI